MTRQYEERMRAMLFDVFGTCVDWRTSIGRAAERFGLPYDLADDWRDQYQPQLETVRSGKRPWVNLDVLHRIGLDIVLSERDLRLPEPQRKELGTGCSIRPPSRIGCGG
jgi:2-haloacid dehalogenase